MVMSWTPPGGCYEAVLDPPRGRGLLWNAEYLQRDRPAGDSETFTIPVPTQLLPRGTWTNVHSATAKWALVTEGEAGRDTKIWGNSGSGPPPPGAPGTLGANLDFSPPE